VFAVLGRRVADGPREGVDRDLDPVDKLGDAVRQGPGVVARVLEVLGEQAQPHLAGHEAGVPPALVLEAEQFDLEDVARFGALDGDRTGERVDRVEAHVPELLGGRVGAGLPVDGVAALEADDLAGFDCDRRFDAVVPDVVDVLVVVGQIVVDSVALRHMTRVGGGRYKSAPVAEPPVSSSRDRKRGRVLLCVDSVVASREATAESLWEAGLEVGGAGSVAAARGRVDDDLDTPFTEQALPDGVGLQLAADSTAIPDCVGSEDVNVPARVLPVSEPSDLTGIGMRYADVHREFEYSGVERVRTGLFSLPTLLSFGDVKTVSQFVHTLLARIDALDGLGTR
jgi:hypothetical protein